MECQVINNPIDIAALFSDIQHAFPQVKKLFLHLHHINDQTLDKEAVQKLTRPSFAHLEELLFAVYSIYDNAIILAIQNLFNPVLQRLFHGTIVQLRLGENIYYALERGVLQTWWSNQLEGKVAENSRQFTETYPSWSKVSYYSSLMRLRLVALEIGQDVFDYYEHLVFLLMANASGLLFAVLDMDPLTFMVALVVGALLIVPARRIHRRSQKTGTPPLPDYE